MISIVISALGSCGSKDSSADGQSFEAKKWSQEEIQEGPHIVLSSTNQGIFIEIQEKAPELLVNYRIYRLGNTEDPNLDIIDQLEKTSATQFIDKAILTKEGRYDYAVEGVYLFEGKEIMSQKVASEPVVAYPDQSVFVIPRPNIALKKTEPHPSETKSKQTLDLTFEISVESHPFFSSFSLSRKKRQSDDTTTTIGSFSESPTWVFVDQGLEPGAYYYNAVVTYVMEDGSKLAAFSDIAVAVP